MILEPVVTFVLGSLALLGVLMSLFWWSIGAPHFPFVWCSHYRHCLANAAMGGSDTLTL
jgi:hypothetical protein